VPCARREIIIGEDSLSEADKLQSDYQRYLQNIEAQANAGRERIRSGLDALRIKAANFQETA
jgi:hypothetical protein